MRSCSWTIDEHSPRSVTSSTSYNPSRNLCCLCYGTRWLMLVVTKHIMNCINYMLTSEESRSPCNSTSHGSTHWS